MIDVIRIKVGDDKEVDFSFILIDPISRYFLLYIGFIQAPAVKHKRKSGMFGPVFSAVSYADGPAVEKSLSDGMKFKCLEDLFIIHIMSDGGKGDQG